MGALTFVRGFVGAAAIGAAVAGSPGAVGAQSVGFTGDPSSDMHVMMDSLLRLHREGVAVPPVRFVAQSPEPAVMGGLACHPDFRGIADNRQHHCPPGFVGAIVYGPLGGSYWFEHVVAHEAYHLQHPGAGPDLNDPFREREATAYACSVRPLVALCGGAK